VLELPYCRHRPCSGTRPCWHSSGPGTVSSWDLYPGTALFMCWPSPYARIPKLPRYCWLVAGDTPCTYLPMRQFANVINQVEVLEWGYRCVMQPISTLRSSSSNLNGKVLSSAHNHIVVHWLDVVAIDHQRCRRSPMFPVPHPPAALPSR
jgi:hypothetical protein